MIKILSRSDERVVLQLETDLKMENAPIFWDEINQVLSDSTAVVLLDFTQIRFVDSSGVGVLLRIANGIKQKSGRFLIFGLNRSIATVFKLSGLLKIFEIIEESEARASFPELFGA